MLELPFDARARSPHFLRFTPYSTHDGGSSASNIVAYERLVFRWVAHLMSRYVMRCTHKASGIRPPIVVVCRPRAGLSVLTTDADGFDHSIVIEVKDPHNLVSSCPAGVSPCLADGSLRVLLDGEEALLSPGALSLGLGVQVSAANLPGACRSFGFEKVSLGGGKELSCFPNAILSLACCLCRYNQRYCVLPVLALLALPIVRQMQRRKDHDGT